MKLITAFIQPDRLTDVKISLLKKNIKKLSVTNILGCGQQGGFPEAYRGREIEVNLLPKIRLEIAVNDEFVDSTIEAIIEGARSGNIGDGKIMVSPLERCLRIRTGEEGSAAIG